MARGEDQYSGGMLPDEQQDKLANSPLGQAADGAVSPFGKQKSGSEDGGSKGGGKSGAASAALNAAGKEGSANDKAQDAARSAIKNAGSGGGAGGAGGGAGGLAGGAGGAVNKVPGLGGDGPITKRDQEIEADKSNTEKNVDALAGAGLNYVAPGSSKILDKLGGVRGATKKAGVVLLIPAVILGLIAVVIINIINNPWEALGQVLSTEKAKEFALQTGGALLSGPVGAIDKVKGVLQLTEVKPGMVMAAGTNVALKPGSTLEKLSKVDWEKAKFQTLDINCGYSLVTKKYAFPDGTQTSLPDFILNTSTNTKLTLEEAELDPNAASCISSQYPIFNLLLRQPITREVNKKANIHLNYAGNKDSEVFQGTNTEVNEYVYDKTLERITSKLNEGPDLTPFEPIINVLEGDYFFNASEFNKTHPDNQIPLSEEKRNIPAQIKKMYQAMADGTSPYDINIKDYFNVPVVEFGSEAETNVIASGISTTMCPFFYSFMDIRNPDNPVAAKNARLAIESRLGGAERGSMKPLTLQDTRKADQLSNVESNGTITQFDNWASSVAYSLDVHNSINGVAMNPEATHNRAYNAPQNLINQVANPNPETDLDNQGLAGIGVTCKAIQELNDNAKAGRITAQQARDEGFRLNQQMLINYKNLKQSVFNNSPGVFSSVFDIGLEQIMTAYIRTGSITAVSGLEPGPDNYNRNSMGNRQLITDYWLRIGGRFLTPEEQKTLALKTENVERTQEKNRGIAYRIFDTSNVRSLASSVRHHTITPKTALTASRNLLLELLNPIKSLASIHSSSNYYLAGEHNRAYAADVTGDQYFKIDTGGLPENDRNIDMLENAQIVEDIKEKGSDQQKAQLTHFDQCQQKKIPNKAYFQVSKIELRDGARLTGYVEFFEYFPETKRFRDFNDNVINDSVDSEFNKMVNCKLLLEDATDFANPAHQLAIRYRVYSYYNTQLDLLGKLSSDQDDPSIYANSSAAGGNSGAVSDKLVLPVDKNGASISSCYGVIRGNRGHSGIDIAYPRGRNVYAAADGEVQIANGTQDPRGYGNMIYLKHNDELYTLYGHLQEILVREGTTVKQGDLIGKADDNGNSFGDHLHFEVSTGPYAARVFKNPIAYTDGLKDLPGGAVCKEGADEGGNK